MRFFRRLWQGEGVIVPLLVFINATLDVPGHDEGLIAGAFTWGLLPGPLSQKLMGMSPLTQAELKERVERYLRQQDGEAAKQAYLNAMATRHHNPGHMDFRGGGGISTMARQEDHRRGRRPEVYTVSEKQQPAKSPNNRYCEYHKSKTHDTVNYSVLKKEMEEKQLKRDLVEVTRSLRAKFDAKNARGSGPRRYS
uniref:Uncharacterized protein n=1 Tax=Lactuca sativa TaxID=4236 RepID=A0A9R1VBX7_LACSA|nr:hypothetical protein LSAT_V11C600303100 [Lactuca sativa]